MRLASGTVLGLAAVVSSPALKRALDGELPLDVTLTRYLIAVVVVWAALSVLGALVGEPPHPALRKQPPHTPGEDQPGP